MVGKHLEEEEAHKLVGFYQGSLVRTVQYYKGLVVLMKLESEVILGMVVVLDLLMVLVEMMGILMVVVHVNVAVTKMGLEVGELDHYEVAVVLGVFLLKL